MKKLSTTATLLASVLALACMFTVPSVKADQNKDEAAAKAERKAKRDAENLKKYDKNGNGKLDADEEAAMKEDRAKMKAKKKSEGGQ